jgi:hypothetical protein
MSFSANLVIAPSKQDTFQSYTPVILGASIRALAFAAFTRDHASRTSQTLIPPTSTNARPKLITYCFFESL